MQVDLSEAEEFEEVASVPLAKMEFKSCGQTYVALQCKPEGALALGKFANILKFRVKEVRILVCFVTFSFLRCLCLRTCMVYGEGGGGGMV